MPYPRMVRYLPNLDSAVRHFTNFILNDSSSQSVSNELNIPAVSLESGHCNQSSLGEEKVNLCKFSLPIGSGTNSSGYNIDLTSAVAQFTDFTGQVNLVPSSLDMLECVAQPCPKNIHRDLGELFPQDQQVGGAKDITVITLSQHTEHDMSGWSEAVEAEREQLLDKFVRSCKQICEALKQRGYWCDFVDPSSGKPYYSAHTNATMFETDEKYKSLGFDIEDLGCCKVIRHLTWGTHAYVGSLFTDAPMSSDIIQNLVAEQK